MVSLKIYHLLEDPIIEKLPHLVAKAFTSNAKILIIPETKEDVISIDKKLWTFSQEIFLPHATVDDELADQNPIIISTEPTPIITPEILILTSSTTNEVAEKLMCITPSGSLENVKSVLWMLNAPSDLNLMKDVQHLISQSKELSSLEISISYYRLEKNVWKQVEQGLL